MVDKNEVIRDSETMNVPDMAKKHGCTIRNIQRILANYGVIKRVRKPNINKTEYIATAVIYKIIYEDYVYIGQTTNFNSRISTHKSDLKRGKHSCKFLQWAYNHDPSGVEEAVSSA